MKPSACRSLSLFQGDRANRFSYSEPIHPPGTLEQYLPKEKHLGPVDMSDVVAVVKEVSEEEKARLVRVANKPPLEECLSLYDLEVRLGSARRRGRGADWVRSGRLWPRACFLPLRGLTTLLELMMRSRW